jgi:HlyD family secretion protein
LFGADARKHTEGQEMSSENGPLTVVAQAMIVPIDGIIEVRPLSDGKVLRVLVQPGDKVEAGRLLAEIDDDVQSATFEQQSAGVRIAIEKLKLTREGPRKEEQAALVAASAASRADANLAFDRWQRLKLLATKGFQSDQAVNEARLTYQAAEARAIEVSARAEAGRLGGRAAEVRAAEETVAAAKEGLRTGRIVLERTRIESPIDGVIMTRDVNPGDTIGSNVISPTLFRIVDPTRLEVRIEIEESLLDHVRLGATVEFTTVGGKTIVGTGTILRIAPQVGRRTIGAEGRVRADSMVRPAWSEFNRTGGSRLNLPVNSRLEARILVGKHVSSKKD